MWCFQPWPFAGHDWPQDRSDFSSAARPGLPSAGAGAMTGSAATPSDRPAGGALGRGPKSLSVLGESRQHEHRVHVLEAQPPRTLGTKRLPSDQVGALAPLPTLQGVKVLACGCGGSGAG